MSTRSSYFLTKDEEHCFIDVIDNSITLEFNKKNIEIYSDDEHSICIEIKEGSELHSILASRLNKI